LAHVEHAKYTYKGSSRFHRFGKGALSHLQGFQWTQRCDHVDASLNSLDQFDRVALVGGVVKDNAVQTWQPGFVSVVRISFQDDPIRTHVGSGNAFHQLI
jgi:hypothetical protein